MNRPSAELQQIQHPESPSEAARHLFGRQLTLARAGWVTLVVYTLVLFVAGLLLSFNALQTICKSSTCLAQGGQLTSNTVNALHMLGLSPYTYAVMSIVVTTITAFVWFVAGAVIFWRKSNDWMALLVSLLLVTTGIGVTNIITVLDYNLSGWRWPALLFHFLGLGLYPLVFGLFPDGRFVPRWAPWMLVIYVVAFLISPFLLNPLALSIPTWIERMGASLLGVNALLITIAQLYRYRRASGPVQRQQIKWVVYALSMALLVYIVGYLPVFIIPSLNPAHSPYSLLFLSVYPIVVLIVPLAMDVAILRYHLWDIDVVINRALVYGTLTVLLSLVYFGLIIGLQALVRLFTGQVSQSPVVIVASTLAIAALFQPLRRRIQNTMDRRFFRRKYDAAKVVAAFSDTLRQEVDLDQLREHLLTVVQETMQPSQVSLWLRPPAHDGTHRTPWRSTLPVSSEER